ncbi:MAG: hypothetical protein GKR93_07695 [Gammaproteobacteria bacterium]|nr:hypothetical protein [Gammaproteobacteria bacterium]
MNELGSEEIILIRENLNKILNDELFFQSQRQSRFLQYVVEQTLTDNAKSLNQYSIGIDVFDRDSSFDPSIDSIVRVEAGRLRSKLRDYYTDAGNTDRVLIEIRKGRYAPSFVFREIEDETSENSEEDASAYGRHLIIDDKPHIAVLAFINSSGDKEQDYFADGISEDIITDLSQFPDLAVIARQSTFSYKDRHIDTAIIGRELGADFVLTGSVRKSGEKVRISAQLARTVDQRQLWAERYDHALDDIFLVQDKVSSDIVSALQLTLKINTTKTAEPRHTSNLEAYDCVLRGAEFARKSNRNDLIQAMALFRRAIALDLEYAEAYARLSKIYVYQWISGIETKTETLDKAKELSLKAVEFCPNSALCHAALGWAYEWQGEEEKARKQWAKAIDLDPSQADALSWLALNLAWSGQTQEAEKKLEVAKRLNPMEEYCFPSGTIAYMEKRFADAIELFDKSLRSDPAFIPGHLFLASSYSLLGEREQARLTAEKILGINPAFQLPVDARSTIKVPDIAKNFRESLEGLGLGTSN